MSWICRTPPPTNRSASGGRDCPFRITCGMCRPTWTQRLKQAGFASGVPTFCALPGVSYYLPHGALKELLLDLGGLLPAKSLLALDYPTEDHGRLARTQTALAAGAGEPMVPGYALTELEGLLEAGGRNCHGCRPC